MLHFVYVIIFLNQIFDNNQVVICLLVKDFQIGKKSERLQIHVGGLNSEHNQAWKKCEALMNQK